MSAWDQTKRGRVLAMLAVLAASSSGESAPELTEVPFTAVAVDDGFWSSRMRINRQQTIPHILDMCEREGRVRNMWRAAGRLGGEFEGTRRHDADLFKAIEAASYSLMTQPDPELAGRLRRMVDAVAAAQQEDGYLHSYVTVTRPEKKRRTDLQLFAAGHLIDAAIAYERATGDRRLLEVARRFADLIDSVAGPSGQPEIPSHPKIEASLVTLYRRTRDLRYLKLAQSFLDERGNAGARGRRSLGVHNLDHCPVRELEAAEGHVICGLFLCEGMLEAGLETNDARLVAACKRLFDDATTRKMFVTGAMGRSSDERFTEPYALNNRTSIGEGCQSAALIRLAHRLLLLEADARYADVIERVAYNNLAANVGLDGKRFYYVNRLSARWEDATGRPYVHPLTESERARLPRFCLERQPWFKVPCCPPNVAMTIATLGRYVYGRADRGLYVNFYAGSRATIDVGGTKVRLTQKTRYPWDGRIRIAIEPSEPRSFDLYLRVPDWCRRLESTGGLYRIDRADPPEGVTVKVNERLAPEPRLDKGYLRLRREWRAGDVVELSLPMPVLRIACDPKVVANAGRVALQRGPIVYCAEAIDHGGGTEDLLLPGEAEFRASQRPELLGGVTVLEGSALRLSRDGSHHDTVPFCAVPYAVWGNRRIGEMDVWIPCRTR